MKYFQVMSTGGGGGEICVQVNESAVKIDLREIDSSYVSYLITSNTIHFIVDKRARARRSACAEHCTYAQV